jgi:hypothetical protein
MKSSWQTETGKLQCRWSGVGERVRYNPAWMKDASKETQSETFRAPVADFTNLSPFGGGVWYLRPKPRPTESSR